MRNIYGESKRDRLEIDEQGMTSAEKKRKREEEYLRQQKEFQRGSRFNLKDRFRNRNRYGNYRTHGASSGSWLSVLGALLLVAGAVGLVWGGMNGYLSGPLRSFTASPEENRASFRNALLAFGDVSDPNLETSIYHKNKIKEPDDIYKMPYPEYIVYVHTGNTEKDKAFNDFILKWEEDISNIPIYRLNVFDLPRDHQLHDIIPQGERPYFVFFKGKLDEFSQYDSILDDPEQLGKVKEYTEGLKDEYDKQLRETDVYGESPLFKDPKKEKLPEPEEIEEHHELIDTFRRPEGG